MHRLNQTVDVVVYKITIEDTIEERILELQEKKRELANSAMEGKGVAKLGMQELMNLFRHDADHLPASNRHNVPSIDLTKPSILGSGSGNSGLSGSSTTGSRNGYSIAASKSRDVGVSEHSAYSRQW